jgi:hypothetical protein
MNFFTPKLVKIRWSSLFFGSFAPHFQTKLSIHASNFLSRFVSMSELELFLLTRVLIPNFNTMDLVKILEKNQKLPIQIIAITLKVTSCRTMNKKKKWKKVNKSLGPGPTVGGRRRLHGMGQKLFTMARGRSQFHNGKSNRPTCSYRDS